MFEVLNSRFIKERDIVHVFLILYAMVIFTIYNIVIIKYGVVIW